MARPSLVAATDDRPHPCTAQRQPAASERNPRHRAARRPSRTTRADPTPSIGGASLLNGGYKDDSALATRSDVSTFTTEPLTRPLEVLGTPTLRLAHATDNPHADLFVRISEVEPDGTSRNVTDGFIRLDPDAADGVIEIEFDPVAHRFAARNRIRLVVAGGSHPRWERNLGTSEDPATSSRLVPSTRTIDLATSSLVLPVGA